MTEKRFERIYEDVDVFCRDHNAKGVSQLIEREDYDRIVDLLNELHDENKELHKVIEENEKVIQSIYEELTKLRHIKENLRKIKNQWNHLIGSICYD